MKKKVLYIVGVAAFVLAIVAAAVAYNALSSQYDAPQDSTTATTSKAPSADRTAPDFAVVNREGQTVRLSDFKGRPVVLNFWATWCGYCLTELPHFEEAYRDYGGEVAFMMIDVADAVRETEAVVDSFIEEHGYTFPVYFDTSGEASRAYSAYSIPLTVFIDRDGQVVYSRPGAMSKEQLLMYMDCYLGVS